MKKAEKKSQSHAGYIEQILSEAELRPGTVTIVDVFHDDSCKIPPGGLCNCDADLRITHLSDRRDS